MCLVCFLVRTCTASSLGCVWPMVFRRGRALWPPTRTHPALARVSMSRRTGNPYRSISPLCPSLLRDMCNGPHMSYEGTARHMVTMNGSVAYAYSSCAPSDFFHLKYTRFTEICCGHNNAKTMGKCRVPNASMIGAGH